ncbi:MAG: fatty acid desaturase [Gammaproteobacteria bacterium]|nr:fatty acid desaturase [Gammaproteobacteria bacterium]
MNKNDYTNALNQIRREGGFDIHSNLACLLVIIELTLLSLSIYLLSVVEIFSWQFWLLEIYIGIAMFRCFVLVHECGHGTLFKTRTSNTLVGTLFGAIALVPYVCWRDVHRQHHKWVGVIDKDPTSVAALDAQSYSPLMRSIVRLMWVLRIPLAAAIGIFSAFWLYPKRLISKKKFDKSAFIAASISMAVTLLPWIGLWQLLGSTMFFTYVLPALLVFYFWFEMINLCHHAGLYPFISHRHPKSVPTYQQEAFCRTATLPRWLAVISCYHFNLHTEHHLFPTVPWNFLPRISEILDEYRLSDYNKQPMPSLVSEIRKLDPFDDIIDKAPSRPVQTVGIK